jgi:hypothetical protein
MQEKKWDIEQLLNMSVEEFYNLNQRAERYHCSALHDQALSSLMDLRELDRVLASHILVSPTIRVNKDGDNLPPKDYTRPSGLEANAVRYVDSLKLFRCFRDGGTVIFRDMHRYCPTVTRLSWDLSEQLGFAVTINGYLTPRNSPGLVAHFDYHDIIVIQVVGSKEWYSYAVNADFPLDNNNWRNVARSVNTVVGNNPVPTSKEMLRPGDVMYMPRGSTHSAKTYDEVSFHLTLELQEWTQYDIVAALLKHVPEAPALRQPIPFGAEEDNWLRKSAQTAIVQMGMHSSSLDSSDLEWTIFRDSHADLFETPVPMISQYLALESLNPMTNLVRRPHLIFRFKHADVITLDLSDRSICFPVKYTQAVERALSGAPFMVEDLTSTAVSLDQVLIIVRALLSEGILIPIISS